MIELDVIDASQTKGEEETGSSGKRFWRSYQDLTNHPDNQEIKRGEFMEGQSKPPSGSSRREFMKLMGASFAFAGLTACRRPVETILPYAQQPEHITEGVPLFYATAMPYRGVVRPLLVESHDGRPTKVEGNPEHPVSQGATSVFEQASVLNLYDPDRSKQVLRDGSESTWQDFLTFAQQLQLEAGDIELAVICEESSSPTMQALRETLEETYGGLQWIEYSAEGDDNIRLGMQEAFGQPLRPQYDFSEAEIIVSLDADFVGPTDKASIENARTLAESREIDDPDDEMSRLYVIEGDFSTTGGMADHRLRMQSGRIPVFAAAVAEAMGIGDGIPAGAQLSSREQEYVDEIAADLQEAGEGGVLVAGETQPPEVHALCAAINGQLNSAAFTLLETDEEERPPQSEQLSELVADMEGGAIDVLLMIGANPVYDLPANLGFADAIAGVEESIHVGLHIDETAEASRWHLPRAHYLEAWGDGRAYDGTLSIIQPLIAPLYDEVHSDIEVLNALATGTEEEGYDLIQEEWGDLVEGANFEREWRRVLHDGFLPDTGFSESQAAASPPSLDDVELTSEDEIEIVFRQDPSLLSGQYANNAWMQELPHPTTKLVWDNVAMISRQTADDLGLDVRYRTGQFYADVISISVGDSSVELPIWIHPGYPDNTIGVTLGYGRHVQPTRSRPDASFWDFATAYTGIYDRDPVANDVGERVADIRPLDLGRVTRGVDIEATGETYMLASTQEHGSQEGRPIVRQETREGYQENPNFARDQGEPLVMDIPYEDYPELWADDHPSDAPGIRDSNYQVNQWGMVIDLNSCNGCNACVIACQSENNIQVVGKEEVARGREMHWIRMDRYYVSEEDNPEEAEMVMQPMLCQHCDNAPCEPVCPVAATVHSADGLNEMVYNRCVGTRYCANNCPYKVRKFNYFGWSKDLPAQVQMAQNPDVTVRFRGVMEKCTWCIQRIRQAQHRANNEDRSLETGEVKTACQQACPSRAITFGDLNDHDSEVVEKRRNQRRYELLDYLNTKPRLSYLARVTNPNPRLQELEAQRTTA